jgi:flagellar P-ring protein precursor FlgI
MPLVPRLLRPRLRAASAARALPVKSRYREGIEKDFLAWKKKIISTALGSGLLLALLLPATGFGAGVKLRDLVMIAGARDNQLVGYGLVAGLAGDGDKDQPYTKQTVANMLMRYGINISAGTISAKNVAVVMVTADIPPFLKSGERIDVTVASMGDAKSLSGGVLLQTPLLGGDGKVYAVAQGPLVLGGFAAGEGGAGGATVTKNHPTTAQIINGALVEKEIPAQQFVRDHTVELLLRDPSFNSASAMAAAINEVFTNSAHAVDSTTVQVQMPDGAESSPVEFIARLNLIEVTPDTPARIIINERTGTIVATAAIHISSCAVASGNITINVASSQDVSQPNAFSSGTTQTTKRTSTSVTEAKSGLIPLQELPTVEKVASALNALGATPRDMMSIFQAMKQAGALQAELITR